MFVGKSAIHEEVLGPHFTSRVFLKFIVLTRVNRTPGWRTMDHAKMTFLHYGSHNTINNGCPASIVRMMEALRYKCNGV
jgi:hypothetical protein